MAWLQNLPKGKVPQQHFEDGLKIEAVLNAELDISSYLPPSQDTKLLAPMIFSHGYTSTCSKYVAYIREFVSHGYIVFALDHLDDSCGYTELKDGTSKVLDTNG